jgi:hypothetical protein
MVSYDLKYRVEELSQMINMLKSEINDLRNRPNDDDLWDNSDITRHWKISTRTLATWRSEGLIGFVQLGNKIWYPKECRDAFLMKNFVKCKNPDVMVCAN